MLAGYTIKGKTVEGNTVDLPLAAKYDAAGNNISEFYASKKLVDEMISKVEEPQPLLNLRGNFDNKSSYAKNDVVIYKSNIWVAQKDMTPPHGEVITDVPPDNANSISSSWLIFLEGVRTINDETKSINEYLNYGSHQEVPHVGKWSFLHNGAIYKKEGKLYMCNNTSVKDFCGDIGDGMGVRDFFLLPEESCEITKTYPELGNITVTEVYSWTQFWTELFNTSELKGIQGERGVGVDIKDPKVYETVEEMEADINAEDGTYALIPNIKTVYVKATSGAWNIFGYTNEMPVIGLSSGGGGGGSNLVFFESEEGVDISAFEKKGGSAVEYMRVWAFDLPEGYSPQSGDMIHMKFKAVTEEDEDAGISICEHFDVKLGINVLEAGTPSGRGVFAEGESTVGRLSGVIGSESKNSENKRLRINICPTTIFGEKCYITVNPGILFSIAGDDFMYAGDQNANNRIDIAEYNSLVTNGGNGGLVFTKIGKYSSNPLHCLEEYPFFKMRTSGYSSGNVEIRTNGDFDIMFQETSTTSLPKSVKLLRGEIVR